MPRRCYPDGAVCSGARESTVLIKDTFAYFAGSRDHSLFRRGTWPGSPFDDAQDEEDAIFKPLTPIRRRRAPSPTLSRTRFLLARSSRAAHG